MPCFVPGAAIPSAKDLCRENVHNVDRKIYPIPSTAISVVRESNPGAWQIEWRCPQCGAPVVLDETDRIFSCAYCRVRLRISCRGPWRYCLPPEKGLTGDPIFVPYRRFRGLAFSCVNQEIQHRVVDSSRLALEIKGLPPSLGYRPQVLKLRPVSPSVGGAFCVLEIRSGPGRTSPGGRKKRQQPRKTNVREHMRCSSAKPSACSIHR